MVRIRMHYTMALLLVAALFSGGPTIYLIMSSDGSIYPFEHHHDTMHLSQKMNATFQAFKLQAAKEMNVNKQELIEPLERIKLIESMIISSDSKANGGLEQQALSLLNRIQSHGEASVKKEDISIMNEQLDYLEKKHNKNGENEDKLKLAKLRERITALEQTITRSHQDTTDIEALKKRASSVQQKLEIILNGKKIHTYGANNQTFCVRWETNMDEWWTHHPTWSVSKENNTHQCFSPMDIPKKAHFFRELYDIQFNGDCDNVTTKRTFNSGFGADMRNVVDGLQYATETHQPMQIYTPRYWKYAHVEPNNSACPRRDMFCYFLPISHCEPNSKKVVRKQLTQTTPFYTVPGAWYYEFATRQQTWLRFEVYKFSSKLNITTPCTVAHVRRADVVLHKAETRRYHEIDEYVNAMSNEAKNIFLLTDDANAISEALYKFPSYNWMYIDRPRHKGSEGGWENQTPSNDPKFEVIVLLSIFRLAKQCDTLIHTKSSFASLLRHAMGARIKRINVDSGRLYHPDHAFSVNISRSYPVSKTRIKDKR